MKLRKMSGHGDETLAEWTETTSPEELKKIEEEFNAQMKKGYFAANIGTETLIDKFDPKADIILIPKMQGGRQ